MIFFSSVFKIGIVNSLMICWMITFLRHSSSCFLRSPLLWDRVGSVRISHVVSPVNKVMCVAAAADSTWLNWYRNNSLIYFGSLWAGCWCIINLNCDYVCFRGDAPVIIYVNFFIINIILVLFSRAKCSWNSLRTVK